MPFPLAARLPLAATLAAGALGGWLFAALALPLPWILGAIFGVMVVSRTPLPLHKPPRLLLTPARIVLGLAIGATFDHHLFDQVATLGLSLLFLVPSVGLTGAAGWLYFRKVVRTDSPTALLCALPGGLAELLILGEDIKADVRRVALVQGIRVLVLVYSLPFAVGLLAGRDLGGLPPVARHLWDSPPAAMLGLAGLGVAGWLILGRLKVSGAPIVGPMLAAAAATLGGVIDHGPPQEVFQAAQWLLGSAVGAVFIGASSREMAGAVSSSLGYLLVLAAITLATAEAVHALLGVPLIPALLAFAPGGQAEMSLIALMLGLDPAYVAIHHLVRLVLLVSLLPPLARRLFPA